LVIVFKFKSIKVSGTFFDTIGEYEGEKTFLAEFLRIGILGLDFYDILGDGV
tara:strand:+ start:439 stop:594 length:156 start_codon:yes stop_codon:yes gene_type:complete